jgi:CubicO group peptidase (beta-lactamase class C family)
MRLTPLLRGATLCVVLVVAAPTASGAQTAARSPQPAAGSDQFDSVRALIRRAIDDGVPSIALAVAKDGRIIWEEGFGMADRERRLPAGPQTMYSLASISKPFTATGLMKLVERGKVHLDRPANDYLGAGRLSGLAGDASQATVRRVMTHMAGLPLHYQFFYENASYRRPSMDTTIARYAILVNPPGEAYQYSNLGYGILDHIISRVSGRSYADYMRREVFEPLGLTHTSVDIGPGLERHAAQRYDSKLRPIPFYTFDHPGGSAVYSSARDLVRFGMFHLKNRLPGQERILADSTIDAMQRILTPDTARGGYGLGWSIARDDNGFRRISHSGGMPGVATVLNLYPSENLAVVVLTNKSDGAPFRIAEEIAATVLPRYAATRAERRAHQASTQAPTSAPAFPPAELAGAWTGTVRTYDGTVPIALLFQPDGDVHVSLGSQLRSLLSGTSFTNGNLVARFPGTIPTEEQRRHAHSVWLNLRLRDAVLRGQASAQTTDEPVYYALTSYVELRRVADRPLTAEDSARFTGTYTLPFGQPVRVSMEGGKLKVDAVGRSRVFLYQGDNRFIASDDPGTRLVFRVDAAGKATAATLTMSGQVSEARR